MLLGKRSSEMFLPPRSRKCNKVANRSHGYVHTVACLAQHNPMCRSVRSSWLKEVDYEYEISSTNHWTHSGSVVADRDRNTVWHYCRGAGPVSASSHCRSTYPSIPPIPSLRIPLRISWPIQLL